MYIKTKFLVILGCLVLFSCTQDFPEIKVDVDDFGKDITIYKNGRVLQKINNERTFPVELQFELNAMVGYDIDSLNQVLYINNYAKELLAISLDNGQTLHRISFDKINFDVDNPHSKLIGDEFYVKKHQNKVLLITEMDVLIFNEKLTLQKKLLDSVALQNPRIPKGFIGDFDYTLKEDSITLTYSVESYLYGLNDLTKPLIIENYTFKL